MRPGFETADSEQILNLSKKAESGDLFSLSISLMQVIEGSAGVSFAGVPVDDLTLST